MKVRKWLPQAELPSGQVVDLVELSAAVAQLCQSGKKVLPATGLSELAESVGRGTIDIYRLQGESRGAELVTAATVLVPSARSEVLKFPHPDDVAQRPHLPPRMVGAEVPGTAVVGLAGLATLLRGDASGARVLASLERRHLALRWDQLQELIRLRAPIDVEGPAVTSPDQARVHVLRGSTDTGAGAIQGQVATAPRRLKDPGAEWTEEMEAGLLAQHNALMKKPRAKKDLADEDLGQVWGIGGSAVKQARLRAQRRADAERKAADTSRVSNRHRIGR